MHAQDIKGLYTALVTPFDGNRVDDACFEEFIEWQIAEGVHGLVPCGTTGESPTLSHEEHGRVIELCIQATKGRVPVMAGTGSNATAEAIEFTRHAQRAGADMALLVAPYYNKPTPEGLFQHFKAIHDATAIPLVLYNIPARSVVDLSDVLLERLADLPRIIGIKDATGDLARVSSIRQRVGNRFALLSGEDATAVGFNAQGGQGCISVSSNVAPRACAQVQTACLQGDYHAALKQHEALMPLHEAMFLETSPGPVKYALSIMGKIKPDIRLPLVMPTQAVQQHICRVMDKVELLSLRT